MPAGDESVLFGLLAQIRYTDRQTDTDFVLNK